MARSVERTSTTAYYPCQLSSLTIPVAGADNPLLTHALSDNAVLRALRALPRAIAPGDGGGAARIGIKSDEAELSRHLDALEQPPEPAPAAPTSSPRSPQPPIRGGPTRPCPTWWSNRKTSPPTAAPCSETGSRR